MRTGLALFLALALLAAATGRLRASAGGGDSYDSGGSDSSFSSSSSSDFSSSSSGSSGGAGSAASPAGVAFMGVAFLLFLFVFARLMIEDHRNLSRGRGGVCPAFDAQSVRAGLAAVKGRDPGFEGAEFILRVSAGFVKVQEAWSARDLSSVRAFLSDGVAERFRLLLDLQRAEGVRNVMSNVKVISAQVVDVASGPHFDVLDVWILASAVDRYVSVVDGRHVRGGAAALPFGEIWTFLRRPGARSLDKGLIEGLCPQCGAPAPRADAAACASCRSWLNSGEHDWVLSEITQVCEWSPRRYAGFAPGVAALSAADPGFNDQFLEDRASLVFWRMQAARRARDAALLAGTATDAFRARLTEEMKADRASYNNLGVGAVDLLACGRAGGFDEAHVRVKWSGTLLVDGLPSGGAWRREILVFIRNPGVLTDARVGLASARCAACGAAPESGTQTACAYCGASFNDGSRHWVLTGTVNERDWRPPLLPETSPAEGLSPVDGLAALVWAMFSDGEFHEGEAQFLERYAERNRIPLGHLPKLYKAARAGRLQAPLPSDPDQARDLLEQMIRMCRSDGKVSEAELKGLVSYGARLSLSAEQVRGLVASA